MIEPFVSDSFCIKQCNATTFIERVAWVTKSSRVPPSCESGDLWVFQKLVDRSDNAPQRSDTAELHVFC